MRKEEPSDQRLFKKVDQRKLCDETRKSNAALKHFLTSYITQSNELTKAVTLWVAKQVRLRKTKKGEKESHSGKYKVKMTIRL